MVEGHIDVLENLARGDAARAVGGEHQIVAGTAGMLASEAVDESERLVKLSGANQKASAVRCPFIEHGLHRVVILRGRRMLGNLRCFESQNFPGLRVARA